MNHILLLPGVDYLKLCSMLQDVGQVFFSELPDITNCTLYIYHRQQDISYAWMTDTFVHDITKTS